MTFVGIGLIVLGIVLALVTGWFGLIVSVIGLLIALAAVLGFGRRGRRAPG